MTINRKLDYVILDLIQSAQRTIKAAPANLGGLPGAGGGIGAPPGGFIGWLPQTRVAYDTSEIASSGIPSSGVSLLDNLNHIRYRLDVVESGGAGTITVVDSSIPNTYLSTDTILFSGAEISNPSPGKVLVVFSGGGSALTVREIDTTPTVNNVNKITVSGMTVINIGGGEVRVKPDDDLYDSRYLMDAPADGSTYGRNNNTWVVTSGQENINHIYNEDLTSQIPSSGFSTEFIYMSGTLRLYYNGIRQRFHYHYIQNSDLNGFITEFTTYPGDVIIVDYDYRDSDNSAGITDSDGNNLTDSDNITIIDG